MLEVGNTREMSNRNNKKQSQEFAGIPKDRPLYFGRTSDTIGLHSKTDVESILQNIVLKISDRCGGPVELHSFIRRYKLTDTKSITPQELRYVLCKFGIMLDQETVNIVFNALDEDRSGSIDLDEFVSAMMNSGALFISIKNKPKKVDPVEELRKKVLSSIVNNSEFYASLKTRISYMELISKCERLGLLENDIRSIFIYLNADANGYINTDLLSHWAKFGEYSLPQKKQSRSTSKREHRQHMTTTSPPTRRPDLLKACNDISQNNPKILLDCFKHIKPGQRVVMSKPEFQQCLLTAGLGKGAGPSSVYKANQFMNALFGALETSPESGYADINRLISFVERDTKLHCEDRNTLKLDEPKKVKDMGVSLTNADKRLRDGMKYGFKTLKIALKKNPDISSGWIEPELLHRYINDTCVPISYTDFRVITNYLIIDEASNRVNWRDFLVDYNPWKKAVPKDYAFEQEPVFNRIGAVSMTYKRRKKDIRRKNNGDFDMDLSDVGSDDGSVTSMNTKLSWKPERQHRQRVEDKVIWSVPHPSKGTKYAKKQYENSPNKTKLLPMQFPHELVAQLPTKQDRFIPPPVTKPKDVVNKGGYHYHRDPHNGVLETTYEIPLGQENKPIAYWKCASQLKPIDPSTLSPQKQRSKKLNDANRDKILCKYDEKTLDLCRRCHDVMIPMWRNVRNEFKRLQTKKGQMGIVVFSEMMKNLNLRMCTDDVTHLGNIFKGEGKFSISYDEFLRVVLVSKPLPA